MPKKRKQPRKPNKYALHGYKAAQAHMVELSERAEAGVPTGGGRRAMVYETLQGYAELLRMDIATFIAGPATPQRTVFPLFYSALDQAVAKKDEHVENMVFQSFFTVLMGWCQGIRETLTPDQAVAAMKWLETNAGVGVFEPELLAWIGHPDSSTTATIKDAIDTAGDATQLLLILMLMVAGTVGHMADGDTEWLRQFDVPNLNLI